MGCMDAPLKRIHSASWSNPLWRTGLSSASIKNVVISPGRVSLQGFIKALFSQRTLSCCISASKTHQKHENRVVDAHLPKVLGGRVVLSKGTRVS